MSYIEVLLFHHKGFVFFVSLSYPLIGDLVFLKEITVLFRVKQVNLASSILFKSGRPRWIHTQKRCVSRTKVFALKCIRSQKKNTELKNCQALSWFSHGEKVLMELCGQQSSWESWLSFSVKLFLTIVWRKPWKSEARTPNSIRKIGGREETLQLFFKQSFMAFKAVLWFLQDTGLDFVFKNLCAW